MSFKSVEELAGRPVVEGYEPPPLPSVIQVERLEPPAPGANGHAGASRGQPALRGWRQLWVSASC
eukprot:3086172-Alexandrium_andersonii.AAC.1